MVHSHHTGTKMHQRHRAKVFSFSTKGAELRNTSTVLINYTLGRESVDCPNRLPLSY